MADHHNSNPPTQATFLSYWREITPAGLKELSFQSVNGWTDRQTNDGQNVSIIADILSIGQVSLTLLLMNTTCPVLVNSVDPDQLASEEAN